MKINNGLKVNDFVVAIEDIGQIVKRSVGIIKNIERDNVSVFFIGKRITIKTISRKISFLDINKTGKPYDKKICNICYLLKDNTEFEINQTDAQGRKTSRPSCKECRAVINGKKLTASGRKELDKIKPKYLFICQFVLKFQLLVKQQI